MTGSLALEEVVKEQSQSISKRIAQLDRMMEDADRRERQNFIKRKQNMHSNSMTAITIHSGLIIKNELMPILILMVRVYACATGHVSDSEALEAACTKIQAVERGRQTRQRARSTRRDDASTANSGKPLQQDENVAAAQEL